MHPNITKALACLQKANYAGYFEEMDRVSIPNNLAPLYAFNKGMFIAGSSPWDLAQKLEALAKEVGKSLATTASQTTPYSKEEQEPFKQELIAILKEKAHMGIVEILEKIDKTLAYEQYDRTQWVSINSKTSPITLEILSATLVQLLNPSLTQYNLNPKNNNGVYIFETPCFFT